MQLLTVDCSIADMFVIYTWIIINVDASSDSLGRYCGNVTAGTLIANPLSTSLIRFMVIPISFQSLSSLWSSWFWIDG